MNCGTNPKNLTDPVQVVVSLIRCMASSLCGGNRVYCCICYVML